MRGLALALGAALLAGMVPAPAGDAAPGDLLWRGFACGWATPQALEMDGQGRLFLTFGSRHVHRLHANGTCSEALDAGVAFAHLAWDGDRGVFWGSAAGDANGTLYTWDPATSRVEARFATTTLGERSPVGGLAYHQASGTLWVGKQHAAGYVRLQFAADGTLLQRHAAAGPGALASDGLFLWDRNHPAAATSGPHRLQPPEPGQPWPSPDVSLGQGMSFDHAFDAATFAPRCAVWGTVPAWPSFLQAVEAPCPSGAVADAWSLGASGALEVREHGRAFTRLGAAANASADVRLEAPAEGLPGASLLAGRSEALALRWPLVPQDGPRAEASSTVGPFEVPGLVAFESLEVRAMSAMGPRGSSSQAQGVVHGLRVGPLPARDVVFDGAPVELSVPGSPARVVLFAVERHGDGERSTGLRVAGLRLVVDDARGAVPLAGLGLGDPGLPGGQLVEVGVAWTGASTGGALPPHPALRSPFDCRTTTGEVACEAEGALAALG